MTELVGILNITPDSFSDGGKFVGVEAALRHFDDLVLDGASLVDIGAESTRPGAEPLTPDEEWCRLEPILRRLRASHIISLDTHHPETVRRASDLLEHPFFVNDVTGFNDPAMRETTAIHKLPCIVSHLPGTDIQAAHQTKPVESVQQVVEELLAVKDLLTGMGLSEADIVLDPGIGFGKSPSLNMQLLRFAAKVPDHDVMIGYSRKRFLGDRRMELPINLEAGLIAVAAGARYLRVHDVAGHLPLLNPEFTSFEQ